MDALRSSPRLQPEPSSQDNEEERLQDLRTTGKWVGLLILVSLVYGNQTVASQLVPDPRQNSWLLMSSPLPTIAACLLYVASLTWWGPLYMTNREPFKGLRAVMMTYNAFQVVFSAWIFWESGMGGWFGTYSFLCQKCDFSYNPQAVRMVHAGYWYLVSKFVDFIDTVFFVLHKKYEHVSLLHVCHHALMPVCMWYGIRYYSGGHTTLTFLLNSFVHTVMYTYYLLAAMGPRVRPYLWWKKYLTSLQIVQFSVVILQNFMVVFVDCGVPSVLLAWVSVMALLFLVLFTDFYIRAYRKRGMRQANAMGKGLTNRVSRVHFHISSNGMSSGVSHSLARQASSAVSSDVRSGVSLGVTTNISRSIPGSIPNGMFSDVSKSEGTEAFIGTPVDVACDKHSNVSTASSHTGVCSAASRSGPAGRLDEAGRLRGRACV
ncbi:very long chain fatty acid elongase 7-like [Panulirus ornatus]|uniref:very long chain fatty acid elongase 7-like n=1 Tax=Panulirus ornatus TaxID=150431 RepID=UPI003A878F7D